MRAIQISSFGNPTDVLELIDIPERQTDVGLALIGVEFAPINHNDLLLIKGTFHWTPSLPTLVGNEGVGRVLTLGPRVSTAKVGDRVVLPLYSNTWRELLGFRTWFGPPSARSRCAAVGRTAD
jgi:NADPH:quinone reductase-like Zn-dependent oxidoreductase